MSEYLSYNNILNDIKSFKRSGTTYGTIGDDFNRFDTPSHKYFKILFYFGSTPEFYSASESSSGLLAPTWELFKAKNENDNPNNSNFDFYNYNSAWAYLKLNNEEERAEKLEHFVTLLSDINTYSPWYFSGMTGIQEALVRTYADGEGKLELNNKKLTIKCLPDAYDNRIGTLLELYRDITWSWIHKKEIIPANLRKFDMAVYIFESPVNKLHKNEDIIGEENDNSYKVSYKMIEFHDCEFNYNSIASGWGDLSNENGMSPTYTIEISYADAYEISYNDIMMRKIGDVILTDLLNSSSDINYISVAQTDNVKQLEEFNNRLYPPKPDTESNQNAKKKIEKPGFLMNALSQVAGHFTKDVNSLFTRAVLGNLHTYSLTKIGDQLNDIAAGNIIKTGYSIAEYIRNEQQRKSMNNKQKPNSNIYPNVESIKQKPIGNIFNKSTLANNI